MKDLSRRVGVVVPCDAGGNVTDADLTAAHELARTRLGAPVQLVEREGLVYAGPTTHVTFEAVR